MRAPTDPERVRYWALDAELDALVDDISTALSAQDGGTETDEAREKLDAANDKLEAWERTYGREHARLRELIEDDSCT